MKPGEVTMGEQMMAFYRGPMTLEKYDKVLRAPGLYDIKTVFNREPDYVTNHDQIGFNLAHRSGIIHIDAAFDEMNKTYHIVGDIDGGLSTELGVFDCRDNNPRRRVHIQKIINKLFLEIRDDSLPLMGIKERIAELLGEYNNFDSDFKLHKPSNN